MWCVECTRPNLSSTCVPVRHQVVGLPDNGDICNWSQVDPIDMLCYIMVTGTGCKGCHNMLCLTVCPADPSNRQHTVDVVEVYV